MKEYTWLKLLLTPFSWLYGIVTTTRNWLYDVGFLPSENPSQIVVSVGNLTVGGTGKTPMIEYLVKKLAPEHRLAILSRGYGRQTTGLLFADSHVTAADIGDEPMQYFLKYKDSVIIAVCENRVKGAEAIRSRFAQNDVLLLDDAFQHRAIGRNINILLSNFNRPFYNDLPFPAGRLRETRAGAKRADVVIVTKCPAGLSDIEKLEISKSIKQYCRPKTPVFFAFVRYGQALTFNNQPVSLKKVKAVAGVALPLPFLAFLRDGYEVTEEVIYPDHYNYTREDVENLVNNLKSGTFVVTTEKDMVKLKPLAEQCGKLEYFSFIPITMDLGTETEEFDSWLNRKLKA
jgi:tetraacyldisaccharide 4'-kinase